MPRILKHSEEFYKRKAQVIDKSIRYYMSTHPEQIWIDRNGRTHTRRKTFFHLAHYWCVERKSIYNWRTTGHIELRYEQMLKDKGIIEKLML